MENKKDDYLNLGDFRIDLDLDGLGEDGLLSLDLDGVDIISTEEILNTKETLDALTPPEGLQLDDSLMLDIGLEDLGDLDADLPHLKASLTADNIDTPQRREEFKKYRVAHLDFLRLQELDAIKVWYDIKRGTLVHIHRAYYDGMTQLQKTIQNRIGLEVKEMYNRNDTFQIGRFTSVSKLLEERNQGFIQYNLGTIPDRANIPHLNWTPFTELERLMDMDARMKFPYSFDNTVLHSEMLKELKAVNRKYDTKINTFLKEWGKVEWVIGVAYTHDYSGVSKSLGDKNILIQCVTNTGRILDMPLKYVPKVTEAFTPFTKTEVKGGHISLMTKTIVYEPLVLYSDSDIDLETMEMKPTFVLFPMEIPLRHITRVAYLRERYKEKYKITIKPNTLTTDKGQKSRVSRELTHTGKFPIVNLSEMVIYRDPSTNNIRGDFLEIISHDLVEIDREGFYERNAELVGTVKGMSSSKYLNQLEPDTGGRSDLDSLGQRVREEYELSKKVEEIRASLASKKEEDKSPYLKSVHSYDRSEGLTTFLNQYLINDSEVKSLASKLNFDIPTLELFLEVMVVGNPDNYKVLETYGGLPLQKGEGGTLLRHLHKEVILKEALTNYKEDVLRDCTNLWILGFINDATRYIQASRTDYGIVLPLLGGNNLNTYTKFITPLLKLPKEYIPLLWEGIASLFFDIEDTPQTGTLDRTLSKTLRIEKGVKMILSILASTGELATEVRNGATYITLPDRACETLTILTDLFPEVSPYTLPIPLIKLTPVEEMNEEEMDEEEKENNTPLPPLVLELLKIALESPYNIVNVKMSSKTQLLNMKEFVSELYDLLDGHSKGEVQSSTIYETVQEFSYLFDETTLTKLLVWLYEELGEYRSAGSPVRIISRLSRERSMLWQIFQPVNLEFRKVISSYTHLLEEQGALVHQQTLIPTLQTYLTQHLVSKRDKAYRDLRMLDELSDLELVLDEEEVIPIDLVSSIVGHVTSIRKNATSVSVPLIIYTAQTLTDYYTHLDKFIESSNFMTRYGVKEYYTDGDLFDDIVNKMRTYITIQGVISLLREKGLPWLSNIEELTDMLVEYYKGNLARVRKPQSEIDAIIRYRKLLREEQAKDQTRMTPEQLSKLTYEELTDPVYGFYSPRRVEEMLKPDLLITDVAITIKEYGSPEFIASLPKVLQREVANVKTLSLDEIGRLSGGDLF